MQQVPTVLTKRPRRRCNQTTPRKGQGDAMWGGDVTCGHGTSEQQKKKKKQKKTYKVA